jgi:hypothetical protein
MIRSEESKVNSHRPSQLRLVRLAKPDMPWTSRRRDVIGFELSPFSLLRYGIGGFGTGATPHMADAQGGSGGVGISSPFPCLDGEQLGSVAGLQVMHLPVKVSLLG